MRTELTQIENTEQYLEGKLSTEERLSFELKLNSDDAFRESVELQKAITERIEISALRDIIKQVHAKKFGNGFNFWTMIVIPLVCIGLAYTGWNYMHISKQEKNNNISINTITKPLSPLNVIAVQTDSTQTPSPSIEVEAAKNDATKNSVAKLSSTAADYNSHSTETTPTVTIKKNPSDRKDSTTEGNTKCFMEFTNTNFVVPFKTYNFTAENGGTFTDKRSGSMITIPSGILTSFDGKQIKGKVTLYYREFRDAADMAYSGIPMTYIHGDSTYNFNSAGMFELYVLQGKDSLSIVKGKAIRVDFFMTQEIQGTAFYKLESKSKSWKQVGKIQPEKDVTATKRLTTVLKATLRGEPEVNNIISPEGHWDDTASLDQNVFFSLPNKANGSLLASGADKGHTYPKLVRGLVCSDFGVYNCDQIYRIGKVVSVKGTFKNSEGNVISKQNVLTMIDLNYNGSFSFDPRNEFSINPKGKNVLLLFTNDNKVFSYGEADFKMTPITSRDKCDFVMTDITEKVRNTEELRKYLGLAN